MKRISDERKENDDDNGIIYDTHEKCREILTEYNDTLRGRCAICLDSFHHDGDSGQDELFSSRPDLVRVEECFHRYHLVCLHRDWFMARKIEKDEFGCEVVYKMPKYKRCPTCRRKVTQTEADYIHKQYLEHLEVDDHSY